MSRLYLSYAKNRYNPDASLCPPPQSSQGAGAKEAILAAEANNEWFVLGFGNGLNGMTKLLVYLTSVKWLSQNYRLGGTLSHAYTTGLTLISGYLNCATVI